MSDRDVQQRIIQYIDFIKRQPREQKYFSFDDGRAFFVDGNKIKMLPPEYAKYYNHDEFYLKIEPDVKKIMYYAFNVDSYQSTENIDEDLGYFDWDKVSEQIYTFLTLHLKELSTSSTPLVDISEKKESTPSSYSSSHPTYDTSRSYSDTTYYAAYKERDAFCNKLTDLLKASKTSIAVDHISNNIKKMCEDKKFDDLDMLLRWITFDKLNVPAMIALLNATRGADHLLKERKEFFGKVKTYLMKIKPARAEFLLRDLEPGKKYKNIVVYENAKQNT